MSRYILHTEFGQIVGHTSSNLPIDQVPSNGYLLMQYPDGVFVSPEDHFLDGEEIRDRPATELPEGYSTTINTDWSIGNVPAGTDVKVDDEVVGVTDDTGLTLSFSASGVWLVKLLPPFPWVEASCEVTVT